MEKTYTRHNLIEDILTLLELPENNDLDLVSLIKKKRQEEPDSHRMETALEIVKFMDEMPGGFLIYHADRDEKIIYANKALFRIFNCDTFEEFQELTQNSFRGIVHPDDLNRVEESIWEQISASQYDFDYVEYRIIRKDGSIGWVDDYGHFIQGNTTGGIFYVFIGDSTEKRRRQQVERKALLNVQKQETQKLQNIIIEYDKEKQLINQEYLRRLEVIEGLSINYESILYADLDENKILPYRLSPRIKPQFNYEYKACDFLWFLSSYVNTYVHSDDRQRVLSTTAPAYIREKLLNHKTYYVNFRISDGSDIQFFQLRIVNVGSRDRISQIVMGSRRIDDEILQEMEQKQILEDALNRANVAIVAKNTFLSNMSHDMRTPLNAIFGFTALAQKHIDDKELTKYYLDRIDESSHQLLDLIEKVLEIAWAESNDTQLMEVKCSLADIAQDIYDSLYPKTVDKNIEFSLGCTELKHPEVYSDPDKLHQLLKYLTNNAIKYTGNDGKVSLSIKESEEPAGEYSVYQFLIQDNGIGISKEFIEHIFEPFERENDTTHSHVPGAGLGLTIAKNIASRMGGDIEVSSTVNQGSLFTVTLRLRIHTASDSHPDNGSSDISYADLPGKRILLVEDNEINLEIESEILQGIGFLIETASDGSIAVDKLAHSAPGYFSLVLMDIQMPVMNGYEAARIIRKLDNPVLAQIPIIALSANAFESDKRMSLDSGMNEHLTKPIDLPLLLNTISHILKGAGN